MALNPLTVHEEDERQRGEDVSEQYKHFINVLCVEYKHSFQSMSQVNLGVEEFEWVETSNQRVKYVFYFQHFFFKKIINLT